jgi:hypothetical protein
MALRFLDRLHSKISIYELPFRTAGRRCHRTGRPMHQQIFKMPECPTSTLLFKAVEVFGGAEFRGLD